MNNENFNGVDVVDNTPNNSVIVNHNNVQELGKIDKQANINNNQSSGGESSSQKTVKALGRGVAAYFSGGSSLGVDSAVTESRMGNHLIGTVADKIDKTPVLSQVSSALDETGIADAANDAMDVVGSLKSGDISKTVDSSKKVFKDINKVNESFFAKKKKILMIGAGCGILGFVLLFLLIISPYTGAQFDLVSGASTNGATVNPDNIVTAPITTPIIQNQNIHSIETDDYSYSNSNVKLTRPLSQFLIDRNTSIEILNERLANEINANGYGTRAGVVAAAMGIVNILAEYGVGVPYYWGGGHGTISTLFNPTWGTKSQTCSTSKCYYYTGLDCSGFVAWAMYNGGYKATAYRARDFHAHYGTTVELNANGPVLNPGDLMYSDTHIVMVIGINESKGKYVIAEAPGSSGNGILKISEKGFKPTNYKGIKMDSYYNDIGNVRS